MGTPKLTYICKSIRTKLWRTNNSLCNVMKVADKIILIGGKIIVVRRKVFLDKHAKNCKNKALYCMFDLSFSFLLLHDAMLILVGSVYVSVGFYEIHSLLFPVSVSCFDMVFSSDVIVS